MLLPRIAFSQVLPERSILTMRAWDDTNPFLPAGRVVRDGLTGGQLPVLGGQRAYVHASLLGEASRRLFELADMPFPSGVLPFETHDDLCRSVSEAIADNTTIVLQYPPDPVAATVLLGGASSEAANRGGRLLVAPAILARLNDKSELDSLVPEEARLPRRYLRLADIDPDTLPPLPVVLKAATRRGSGAGLDVRICLDAEAWRSALAFFHSVQGYLHGLVVEQFEPFQRSWCANFAIPPDGRRWFTLGVSEQLIVDGRRYVGNIKGHGYAPPEGSTALIAEVAGRAMAAGFRGIGGFDFAVAGDGRLICFDANLRINGCTTQLLLHDAACARIGANVTRTLRVIVTVGRAEMVERLAALVENGRLVPVSFLDAELHPMRPSESVLTGLLVGWDGGELEELADGLRSLLSPG